MAHRRLGSIFGIIMLTLATLAQPAAARSDDRSNGGARGGGFVQRVGAHLELDGRPFRFAGTNNYYLMYKSQAMVDNVLNAAAAG